MCIEPTLSSSTRFLSTKKKIKKIGSKWVVAIRLPSVIDLASNQSRCLANGTTPKLNSISCSSLPAIVIFVGLSLPWLVPSVYINRMAMEWVHTHRHRHHHHRCCYHQRLDMQTIRKHFCCLDAAADANLNERMCENVHRQLGWDFFPAKASFSHLHWSIISTTYIYGYQLIDTLFRTHAQIHLYPNESIHFVRSSARSFVRSPVSEMMGKWLFDDASKQASYIYKWWLLEFYSTNIPIIWNSHCSLFAHNFSMTTIRFESVM